MLVFGLIGTMIGAEETRMINELLKSNTTLIELSLHVMTRTSWMKQKGNKRVYKSIENDIGDEGTRILSEGLKRNSTLTALYLRCDGKN